MDEDLGAKPEISTEVFGGVVSKNDRHAARASEVLIYSLYRSNSSMKDRIEFQTISEHQNNYTPST